MEAVAGASAVAGLVSLAIHLFEGCVKGFILLSAAHDQGRRAAIINCRLEWEHLNLFSWALAVGLLKEPPELNAPNLPLIGKTLENLHQLLTDTQTLREVYYLDIDITGEELKSIEVSRSSAGTRNHRWRHFMTNTARVYQSRTSAWKKLKWAALDQDRFSHFLDDIHYFVEQLSNSLRWHEQHLCIDNTTATIEAVISSTKDKSVLDAVTESWKSLGNSLGACAALKKDGMILDAVAETNTLHHPKNTPNYQLGAYQNDPALLAIKCSDISFESRNSSPEKQQNLADPATSLQKAIYVDKVVFIEWKDVFDIRDRRLGHRVAGVAGLLASIEDHSFHSLKCVGYVKDTQNQRYGYIFRPPADDAVDGRSLQYLLSCGRCRPALRMRLEIAITLSEAIRQLHNAGWLHKSVQPRSVWFFSSTWQTQNTIYDLPAVYIGGYSFARADRPTETTEDPRREQFHYRHPLSTDADRVPYCKAFDLYSLGCVLLEIALWKPLSNIVRGFHLHPSGNVSTKRELESAGHQVATQTNQVAEESPRDLIVNGLLKDGSLAQEVRFLTGERYLEVIRECLVLADHVDDEDHDELVFETHLRHLKVLRALREHL